MTDTISTDKEFNQLMGDILIELLANEGLKELEYGIQQRVQTKADKRSNK